MDINNEINEATEEIQDVPTSQSNTDANQDQAEDKEVVDSSTPDTDSSDEPVLNEGDELSPEDAMKLDSNSVRQMINTISDVAKMFENVWDTTRKEFDLHEAQMKQVYSYNIEHRRNMPEGLTEEEQKEWDLCNGLDNITEEEVVQIFGEGHPIISPIAHSVTIDRLKDALRDLINYVSATRELKEVHDAHSSYLEAQEDEAIRVLQAEVEKETDPEKKEAMKQSLDNYLSLKYLDFLAEPMTEDDINRIVNAIKNKDKINYYLTRCRENLKEIGLSDHIIIVLSQLEKRLLPEKYHPLSNLFLMYYLYMATYCKPKNIDDLSTSRVVAMTVTMDVFIRKAGTEESHHRVMNNVLALEDQFLGRLEYPMSDK